MCEGIMEAVSQIYQHIEDEESRDIFKDRVMLSITGDWKYAKRIVKKYLRGYKSDKIFTGVSDSIESLELDKDSSYIIYGAGRYGEDVFRVLKKIGVQAAAFCDQAMEKQNTTLLGLPVLSPEDLKHRDEKILVAVWNHFEEIAKALKLQGISGERLIDAFSVKEYTDKNQYFDKDIIHFGNEEIFVDCGCYDFETSEIFMQNCPEYKKIICFEPDEKNRIQIQKRVRKLSAERIEVLPYGVWNKREALYFGGEGSSAMINSRGKEKIEARRLDDIIQEKITFIKMDVEGAEQNALEGAAETIRRYRPKLAVSIYHKPEDILEIPFYLLKLVPEYRFFLRHYSNYFATETVLYAVL